MGLYPMLKFSKSSCIVFSFLPQQRFLVVCPLCSQLRLWRVSAAAQLHRDLKAVAVHVVKVLHPAGHVVPARAVCDAAGKL
jgi:hypothetical protein